MSAVEKVWNAAMRWYAGAHHRLAQDWPRLDNLCHMIFYYSFFATKKIVIFVLNTVAHLLPILKELPKILPKAATDYVDLMTKTHSDIQQINGGFKKTF